MNWSEMYGPDADGFFDIQCGCGSTDFVVQGNEDGETIRIECFECKRRIALKVEEYLDDLMDNGFNNSGFLTKGEMDESGQTNGD